MKNLFDKEALRSNIKRGEITISMIYAVMAIDIVIILFSFLHSFFIQNIGITQSVQYINYLVYYLFSTVYMIAFIISSIFFIMWFRRAYYNLHIICSDLNNNEGWAAGCWFVPIANLYMPFQIMKEIYTKTNKILSINLSTSMIKLKISVVNWWWILCILMLFKRYLVYKIVPKLSDNVGDASYILNIIEVLLMIFLALITVKIISDYMKAEQAILTANENEIFVVNQENDFKTKYDID